MQKTTRRQLLMMSLMAGALPWRSATASTSTSTTLQLPTVYDPAIDPAP